MTGHLIAWINEIHYDNAGSDVGEFVEIAAPVGTDLTGYSIVLYNGSNGAVYTTVPLGTASGSDGALDYYVILQSGIQNGSPDGIALVDAAGVTVEFLSYEGSFVAVDGPAAGLTSTDIGIAQPSDAPIGSSLARTVTDGAPTDVWTLLATGTPGGSNDAPPPPPPPPPSLVAIYDIQGTGLTSALLGDTLRTSGIVTAVDSNGFYLQDATGDGDTATSDALFVFTGSRPTVAVGDEAEVTGSVSEFASGSWGSNNQSTTQVSATDVIILGTGNALPDAIVLGVDRTPPTEDMADGVAFWESLEGMRVTAPELEVVGSTNRFFEIFTVLPDANTGLSDRGTLNISPDDFNPERIQVASDFGIFREFTPEVNAGDTLLGVTGVVSYSFGNYEIIVTESYDEVRNGLEKETTTLTGSLTELTLASYNVLNLDPNDDDGDTDISDGRFESIAADILFNLGAPDIIALQEVQDNSGSANDGVVSASETLQLLIDTMDLLDDGEVNGSTGYAWIDNTFITDNASGGQPGGNIRTAFLYNTDRVDLVEGSVGTIGGQEPGEAFDGARLPLTATFLFNGQEIDLVNVHLSSKGGSAPIMGTEQPFEERQEDVTVNGSLDERQAQATAVSYYVEALLAEDPDANVAVLGDFNEFEFVSPLLILEDAGLENLTNRLDPNERYSYVFQGNSQSLDHILVSDSLARTAEYDAVHINSEFAETSERSSDHDPVLSRFEILPEDSFTVSFGTKPGNFANGRATVEGEVWTIEDGAFVANEVAGDAFVGLIRKTVDIDAADVMVSASLGDNGGNGKAMNAWVSNSDGAIGVRSSGENGMIAEAFLLDGAERLIFEFTGGDATEVEFDFAQDQGSVLVEAFDDGVSLGTAVLDLEDGMLSLGFAAGADRVTLQALGDGLSIESFEYERLFDDLDLVA